MGNLFNPSIFAYITGATRAQLYKYVIDNNLAKYVVEFATDSICTTKNLNLNSSKLGEFSFKESADDVYYLQNGMYRFNGKWKQRGIDKAGGKTVKHVDSFERDGRLYLKYIINKSMSLRASIKQNQVSEIGKIKPMVREININADR